jgi:hypothetical protein
MARVESLVIEGDRREWRSLGLTVTNDGAIPLYGTSLQLIPPADPAAPAGIVAWNLSGSDASQGAEVDGLPTRFVDTARPVFAEHELGAVGLDHVVVLTSELERTSTAIARVTGCELRRVREVGTMRQGFHRIGSGGLIVEIVERPEVTDRLARFWGVVVNVDDLDAACALLGAERIGQPKDAVQPGRRIATVRTGVGLGVPLALMTP